MSNVARRPRGRKPAAVYWRRRIVVLAVVAGLVWLVVRLVSGGEEPAGESSAAVADESPAASTEAKPTPTSTTSSAQKRAAPVKKRVTTWLRSPSGRCDVGEVLVVPDVVDTAAGGPVPLRMGLSTTAQQPCTLELSAEDLAVEITSGDDVIWQSSACKDVLQAGSFVLRPGWLSYVDLTWNGRRGVDDCLPANEPAQPGYYWAEAAIIGGEPARSQFRLETPPPPPSKKPKPQGDDQAKKDEQQPDENDPADEPPASPSSDDAGQT